MRALSEAALVRKPSRPGRCINALPGPGAHEFDLGVQPGEGADKLTSHLGSQGVFVRLWFHGRVRVWTRLHGCPAESAIPPNSGRRTWR